MWGDIPPASQLPWQHTAAMMDLTCVIVTFDFSIILTLLGCSSGGSRKWRTIGEEAISFGSLANVNLFGCMNQRWGCRWGWMLNSTSTVLFQIVKHFDSTVSVYWDFYSDSIIFVTFVVFQTGKVVVLMSIFIYLLLFTQGLFMTLYIFSCIFGPLRLAPEFHTLGLLLYVILVYLEHCTAFLYRDFATVFCKHNIYGILRTSIFMWKIVILSSCIRSPLY